MQKKKLFFLITVAIAIFFFSRCMSVKNNNDPRGKSYAGSETCMECHQQICASYLHTAHYQSAGAASFSAITGSFSKDSNTLIVNDSTKVVMEKREGVPYQVLYINGQEKRSERFDIVFGYAKGQTYLYWKDDLLFQLPASYFNNLHSWTSSPGYPPGMVIFDRPVYERCFECHTSYISESSKPPSGPQNAKGLEKNTLIYNIDCERCHGPAATHVNFHTAYPGQKEGRYIVSYKSLSRAQKIDMCAVCHSGNKNLMLGSTFLFKPGDTLSKFMLAGINTAADSERPDVHGNQTLLLASSKCFINSNMDCATCHNTHINDRGNYTQYAQHCQSCHSDANHNFCKMANSSNISFIKNNCTRCHMPEQPSNIIKVKTSETKMSTAILMVNHKIAVYPEASEKIMGLLKKNNNNESKN
jgi:nitrate/TMAO reductase-like tetraheme cytochrome c subunit